ncbi:formylglycine-generating enzyme family protein [Amycolatopsis jiangsuensis]|uniref:formylglycine-generating enzyme family protein n=1 Tax=Amycolatopsis jiangsuensis TaxID=1181879 RepID=UPI0028A96F00|nr:SUMF1/EgtB/PvdO family nonheme iron enzyme [Amycolatopsis jiangsuensis]
MRMLPIPPGAVTLTDRRTESSWTVDVPAFELGATPVTRSLYDGGGELPAVEVSWWDAVRFCNAQSVRDGLPSAYRIERDDVEWDRSATGYRLPTEAEWEHACRAGTAGPRYGDLDDIAWYRGNSDGRLHQPGEKLPNAWGVFDALGNTWDWCWDRYDPATYGEYRVLKGGGWADEHWSVRVSVRRRSHPAFRVDDVGFRLARTVPAASGQPTTTP